MPAAQEPKGAAADKKPSQRRRRGGKKHPKPDGDQRRREKQEAPAEEAPQEPVPRSRGRRNRNPQKEPEAKKLEEDSDVLLAFGALLKTNDPAAAAAHASYERHEDQARFIEDARRLLAMSPSERKAMVQRAPPGMAMPPPPPGIGRSPPGSPRRVGAPAAPHLSLIHI